MNSHLLALPLTKQLYFFISALEAFYAYNSPMQTFSERLQFIINSLYQGKARRFALDTGISPATVSIWLNDPKSLPTTQSLRKIVAKTGYKIEWLISGVDTPGVINEQAGTYQITSLFNNFKGWMDQSGWRTEHMDTLIMNSDSMYPTIFKGDLIVFEKNQKEVFHNAIYVVCNEFRGITVNRIQKLNNGSIIIKSDSDRYENETIDKCDLNTIKIVGKAVWYGRQL